MQTHKVKNAFMCSKETVRCIHLAGMFLFVAGSDPIIRRFDTLNAEKENQKLYNGHKGWVNAIVSRDNLLFSAGDDHRIILWNIESGR